jgi:hypothetical protein
MRCGVVVVLTPNNAFIFHYKACVLLLYYRSTVVEHLPCNSEVDGSSPATAYGTRNKKNTQNVM